MTAVGLLCNEYLGVRRNDPSMTEGVRYLMGAAPNKYFRDCYYFYYATQAIRNFEGSEWQTWNQKMQQALISSQARDGCASGSWSPTEPTGDVWGAQGGRLFVTALSTLCLEVYYRYPPVYDVDEIEGH